MEIFIGLIFVIVFAALIYSLANPNKASVQENRVQNLNFQTNDNAEPYCIVFDVETTGLILNNNLKPSVKNLKEAPNNYPRIVSLSWGVFSRDEILISEGDLLIQQEKEIPAEAVQIHGITTEKANTKGINILEALNRFELDCQKVQTLVGHNVLFDKRVIESEFIRAKLKKPFTNKKPYCTMRMGKEFLKAYKLPTLAELCIGIYGQGIKDQLKLHNSQMDTFFTSKCFFYLKKQPNKSWNRYN